MSKEPAIPTNYQTVMPYLIVQDAAKFITFTERVFGATHGHMAMRDESVIMHGEVVIGGSTIMFADATEQFQVQTAGLFVYVSNANEAYNKAVEEGAVAVTPLSDRPYGRSGGVKDPFGNTWWITSPL